GTAGATAAPSSGGRSGPAGPMDGAGGLSPERSGTPFGRAASGEVSVAATESATVPGGGTAGGKSRLVPTITPIIRTIANRNRASVLIRSRRGLGPQRRSHRRRRAAD